MQIIAERFDLLKQQYFDMNSSCFCMKDKKNPNQIFKLSFSCQKLVSFILKRILYHQCQINRATSFLIVYGWFKLIMNKIFGHIKKLIQQKFIVCWMYFTVKTFQQRVSFSLGFCCGSRAIPKAQRKICSLLKSLYFTVLHKCGLTIELSSALLNY